MQRVNGGKQAKARRPERRRLAGVEALEGRRLLAADFQVVTGGGNIWIEANGDQFRDVFTLTHVGQNEVNIRIDFEIDQNGDGAPDGVDWIEESFDIAQLEFDAALSSLNFTGFVINGFRGNDKIDAGMLRSYDNGQFTFDGGIGNDEIIGGRRGDIIIGGPAVLPVEVPPLTDNDTITNADHLDVITGGAGTDSVTYGGHSFGATLISSDIENVTGTEFNDVIDLSGNTVPVTINGLGGNDTLSGGSANDTINGGSGNDTINGNGGNDTLNGDAGDDTINGGTGNDVISGGADNDTLNGDAGNDTLNGDAGDDTLNGGANDDTLNGGAGNDRLDGGTENDTLNGGDGDDWLIGGLGNDRIDGGEAGETNGDTVDYSGSGGPMNIDLNNGGNNAQTGSGAGHHGNDTIVLASAGNSTVENIRGSNHNDQLRGDEQANKIEGLDGDDLIFGRGGDDVLEGGDGNDRIGRVGVGGDAATPSITASTSIFATNSDIETDTEPGNDIIRGGAGNDTLRGGLGDDVIEGGEGDDWIEGDGWTRANNSPTYTHLASGNDTLDGNGGNDVIFATDEADPFDDANVGIVPIAPATANATAASMADFIDGGAGDDVLYGHVGVDNIIGDDGFAELGNDQLFGLAGADFLNGGNGFDLLVGGEGADMLFGGSGLLDGIDILRIEATGAGGTADLPDTVVIGGSPLGDLIQVKGLLPNDTTGQSLVTNLLDSDLVDGTLSDYEPGSDTLDFVAGFSDFS